MAWFTGKKKVQQNESQTRVMAPSTDGLAAYLQALVDRVYGSELSQEERREAVSDLSSSFHRLFNAHLLAALRDDQLDYAEVYARQGKSDKIVQLAAANGVDMGRLISVVRKEFEERYAPTAD